MMHDDVFKIDIVLKSRTLGVGPMQTEYLQMFEKCYNFQCSNFGHLFFAVYSKARQICQGRNIQRTLSPIIGLLVTVRQ